jgi:hypothetical protein
MARTPAAGHSVGYHPARGGRLAILHDLKADPATADIPVILLTIVERRLASAWARSAYLLNRSIHCSQEALNRVIGATTDRQKHVLVVDGDPGVADMLREFAGAEFGWIQRWMAKPACRPWRRAADIILLDIIIPPWMASALSKACG